MRAHGSFVAHELGHDRLHQRFASALLIDDDAILSLVQNRCDIYQIFNELGEDMNLMLIKIDELRQGYDLRIPYRPQVDF